MFRNVGIKVVAASAIWVGALPLLSGAAQADATSPQIVVPAPNTRLPDLSILRSEQDRQMFQLQQQINRDQDRRMILDQVQRPQVPIIGPRCGSYGGC